MSTINFSDLLNMLLNYAQHNEPQRNKKADMDLHKLWAMANFLASNAKCKFRLYNKTQRNEY